MAMMKFRQVRVIVRQGEVSMDVRMRLVNPLLRRMLVAVVVAMRMAVVVFHLLMNVQMTVVFEKQKNDSDRHDHGRKDIPNMPPFPQQGNGRDGTNKRGGSKKSCLSCCSQHAQSVCVQNDAHPVAQKAQCQGRQDNHRRWEVVAGRDGEGEGTGSGRERLEPNDRNGVAKG